MKLTLTFSSSFFVSFHSLRRHHHRHYHNRIENIDQKAVSLADSANRFKSASTSLKRTMRCRYYKIIIFFSLLVSAILAAIIAYFVQKKDEDPNAPK